MKETIINIEGTNSTNLILIEKFRTWALKVIEKFDCYTEGDKLEIVDYLNEKNIEKFANLSTKYNFNDPVILIR